MSAAPLYQIQDWIQEDVGNRGLRTDPAANLVTACSGDFAAACHHLAQTPNPAVGVVTGFFIPQADPPAGETDGPLGALFLARAFVPWGIKVVLITDSFCRQALEAGLAAADLAEQVRVVTLPAIESPLARSPAEYSDHVFREAGPLTHLIALERVGPSHTKDSVQAYPGDNAARLEQFRVEVPAEGRDRCFTMRGRDITDLMSPAHYLFEEARRQKPRLTTIGIGDGGNEIGMGKISWEVIRRNIPRGGLVACRVATDALIVCGVSNWGAYGLVAGFGLLNGWEPVAGLFDTKREHVLLQVMVDRGPLVDGVLGRPSFTVDGLDWDRYAGLLPQLGSLFGVG